MEIIAPKLLHMAPVADIFLNFWNQFLLWTS